MSFFSDWGGTEWAGSVESASAQADGWIEQTADGKTWPDSAAQTAYDLVDSAEGGADGDPATFWSILLDLWEAYDLWAFKAGYDGWVEMGEVWASAANTTYSTSQGRDAGTFLTVVSGGAEGAWSDVKIMTDPTKSPVPWIVGGAVLFGAWSYFSAVGKAHGKATKRFL